MNPPFTEVCRNCLRPPSPDEVEGQSALLEPPRPKKVSTGITPKELLNATYPFAQIKSSSVPVKVLAFFLWTIQIAAFAVFAISFSLVPVTIAAAIFGLVELINRKILHIQRE